MTAPLHTADRLPSAAGPWVALPAEGIEPLELDPARPAYRPFRTKISSIRQISPHFTRVTFRGPSLRWFATHGLDQRVKIVVPFADGSTTDIGFDDPEVLAIGCWYDRWRELDDEARNPIRTYTVRGVRACARPCLGRCAGPCTEPGASIELGEVDIDIVRHAPMAGAELGPGAAWLERAAVGDEVVLVGPDALSPHSRIGIDWHPGDAGRLLIVADETAVPAALSVLESLPASARVDALLEVPSAADRLPIATVADARITWLARDADAASDANAGADTGETLAPGGLLPEALERWAAANGDFLLGTTTGSLQTVDEIDIDHERIWDSADARGDAVESTGFFAWLAGEQSAIKRMRRHLVSDLGVDRRAVAFMGYWRLGVADLG